MSRSRNMAFTGNDHVKRRMFCQNTDDPPENAGRTVFLMILESLHVYTHNPMSRSGKKQTRRNHFTRMSTRVVRTGHNNYLSPDERSKNIFPGKLANGLLSIAGEVTLPDMESPVHVAVKVLKEGASREIREDFKREVDITSAFDHPNILKLIGVVEIGIRLSHAWIDQKNLLSWLFFATRLGQWFIMRQLIVLKKVIASSR